MGRARAHRLWRTTTERTTPTLKINLYTYDDESKPNRAYRFGSDDTGLTDGNSDWGPESARRASVRIPRAVRHTRDDDYSRAYYSRTDGVSILAFPRGHRGVSSEKHMSWEAGASIVASIVIIVIWLWN